VPPANTIKVLRSIAATAAATAIAACAATQDPNHQDPNPSNGNAENTPETSRVFGDTSRIVGPEAVGLEAHWWLAASDDRRIVRALATHATNTELSAKLGPTRDTWREDGFRLALVPFQDLDTLFVIAPPEREWRRAWLGRGDRWDAVIAGRRLSPTQPVIFDSRPVSPGAGTPRLLVRAWPEPAPPDRATLPPCPPPAGPSSPRAPHSPPA